MLNAGGLYALAVHLVNTNDGSSCTVKEIALDGMYLDQPRDLGTGRSVLFAASRVDWLVKCPIPGTYEVKQSLYFVPNLVRLLVIAMLSSLPDDNDLDLQNKSTKISIFC